MADDQGVFSVGSRLVAGAVVVDVHGAVDMLSAPELARELRVAVANEPVLMVIDLSQVSFLASAGLSVLLIAHELAGATVVRVVVGDAAVSRPLRVTGLDSVLDVFRSVDAALVA